MRRRDLITLITGLAVWPVLTRAQERKLARIRALYIGIADEQSFKRELREAMREQGYVEGRDVAFEFRSAEGKLDRLPDLAAELVRQNVDVIVALYVPCALAAKQATRDIPIVILAAGTGASRKAVRFGCPGRQNHGWFLQGSCTHG